jgi:hypothetical protein
MGFLDWLHTDGPYKVGRSIEDVRKKPTNIAIFFI